MDWISLFPNWYILFLLKWIERGVTVLAINWNFCKFSLLNPSFVHVQFRAILTGRPIKLYIWFSVRNHSQSIPLVSFGYNVRTPNHILGNVKFFPKLHLGSKIWLICLIFLPITDKLIKDKMYAVRVNDQIIEVKQPRPRLILRWVTI